MFLFKLALKNLLRHKKRTVITAIALAYGLMMLILSDSLLQGIYQQSNINLKGAETGDGKIINTMAFEDLKFLPLNNRINSPEEIIGIVEDNGGKAVPRVNINGDLLYTTDYFEKDGVSSVLVTLVDLDRDNEVFNVFKENNLESGRFMTRGEREVVIGSWLAEDIGATTGAFITLSLRTAGDGDDPGYFQTIDAEIVGIINVESPNVNRRVVYYPLDSGDFDLDLVGSVTEVAVKLPVTENPVAFKKKINQKLPKGYQFYDWKELSADYIALTQGKSGGSFVIIGLIAIIAMVGITNTMLMTINERQRELGMMRALGMDDSEIRRAFILEAGGIGIIGSIMGLFLGILANIPMVNIGIDYSMWFREMDMGYRVSSVIRGLWNWDTMVLAVILGIIIPVVVAIGPTRKAINKSIPDCINGR